MAAHELFRDIFKTLPGKLGALFKALTEISPAIYSPDSKRIRGKVDFITERILCSFYHTTSIVNKRVNFLAIQLLCKIRDKRVDSVGF